MILDVAVRNALKSLASRQITITPAEYKKAFCQELSKAGITHEDCDQMRLYIERLGDSYKKLLKNYPVKNIEELLQFLISQCNRNDPSEYAIRIEALYQLVFKLLDVLAALKSKDIATLSSASKDRLKSSPDILVVTSVRQAWDAYQGSLDFGYLDKLDGYCITKKGSFESIVDEIVSCFEKNKTTMQQMEQLIKEALKPSFADMGEELENFNNIVKTEHRGAFSVKAMDEAKALVTRRILLDRSKFNEELGKTTQNIESIEAKFKKLYELGGQGEERLGKITSSLKNMSVHEPRGFEKEKQNIAMVSELMKEELRQTQNLLRLEEDEIVRLKFQLNSLQKQLQVLNTENREDQLTGLSNQRAFSEELAAMEDAYLKNSGFYTISIFNMDNTSELNRRYGRMAIDVVLTSFAQLLKKHSKSDYHIFRYEGDSFYILQPNEKKSVAEGFAYNFRESVERAKFMYKGQPIAITVSGAVASREEGENIRGFMKLIDMRLNIAKSGGKNRVVTAS